jgi:hypothetical protein
MSTLRLPVTSVYVQPDGSRKTLDCYVELDPDQILGDLPERLAALEARTHTHSGNATTSGYAAGVAPVQPQQDAKPDLVAMCDAAKDEPYGAAKLDADEAACALIHVIAKSLDEVPCQNRHDIAASNIIAAIRANQIGGLSATPVGYISERWHNDQIAALRQENDKALARVAELEDIVGRPSQTDYHVMRDSLTKALAELAALRLEYTGLERSCVSWMEAKKRASEDYEKCKADLAAATERYTELIMSVGNKYPDETRHQTALRYIHQAERLPTGERFRQERDKALAELAAEREESQKAWDILVRPNLVRCRELSTQAAGAMAYMVSLEGQLAAAAERADGISRNCQEAAIARDAARADADALAGALRIVLGETSPDGRLTMLPAQRFQAKKALAAHDAARKGT